MSSRQQVQQTLIHWAAPLSLQLQQDVRDRHTLSRGNSRVGCSCFKPLIKTFFFFVILVTCMLKDSTVIFQSRLCPCIHPTSISHALSPETASRLNPCGQSILLSPGVIYTKRWDLNPRSSQLAAPRVQDAGLNSTRIAKKTRCDSKYACCHSNWLMKREEARAPTYSSSEQKGSISGPSRL